MRSIMVKLWLAIISINLIVLIILGIFLGKLVHDFHFNLMAQDLRMMGNEINIIYGKSGKDQAQKYALAMAQHTSASIAVLDAKGNIVVITDQRLSNSAHLRQTIATMPAGHNSHLVAFNPIFKNEMITVIIPSLSKGFKTVIFAPAESITSTINRLWLFMLLSGLVVMLLMAMISYLISKKISSPLLKLNKEAHKIAEGEFDNLQLPKSNDEIGQLSDTIHYAAQNIKRTLMEREQLSQIQKDFVANVSHDLRTPLSLIRGYAIALQQNIVEGKEKDNAINIIIEESERMQRLSNELLDLAKLENGKKVYSMEKLELGMHTKKIIGQQRTLVDNKNIELLFSDETNKREVFADADAITQVILNLFNNAVNHTAIEGTIKIQLILEENQVFFSVNNSGSFIPPEDIPFLWERFYKAEKSRNRSSGGTGLGLAIVKGIISAHNGQVGVESSQEQGTTFWFLLPSA